MYKLKSLLFLSLIIPATTFSATAFDEGVPLELVEQFASGQIRADLPVDFPDFDLPDSVTVMGSLDTNFNQTVIFSSTESAEAGSMALVDSFQNAGWSRLISLSYEQPQNGFFYTNVAPLPPGLDDQYCHDRYGTFTLSTPEGSNNLINLRLMNQALMQPGFSCQQQNQQREMQRGRAGGGFPFGLQNREYMPRLEMPEDENQNSTPRSPFFGMGGFSGSSNDVETQASISGDWSVGDLNQHFASQLEAQGWQLDSEWEGEVSSGGNWMFSPQPDLNFIGILTVLERTEGIFELKFRMLTRGGNTGGAMIRGINQGIFVNDAVIAAPVQQDDEN